MNIGFIGTGVMGSRMVTRLLQAGYQVTVYNRTIEKAQVLVELGAKRTDSISKLAACSDVICTCLSMPKDVRDVYFGVDGIISNAKSDTICIDFTTVGPDTSREVYNRAAKEGIEYLDAPVSGGPEGVEQGSLTIMVGGTLSAFEKAKPILVCLGETIEYLGSAGSGSIAKLINQYLVAVHSLAASEAMVTGAALGLDSEKLYEILKVSYGDSRMLRRHMEQHVLGRNFDPGGAVKYIHKDVGLANKLVEEVGLSDCTGKLAEQAFGRAMEQELFDLDMSAVILPLERETGALVKAKE